MNRVTFILKALGIGAWRGSVETSESLDLFDFKGSLWSLLSNLWDKKPVKALEAQFFMQDKLFLKLTDPLDMEIL